jgi:hypothetical protein
MDTITKKRKTVRNSNMIRISDKSDLRKISLQISHSITALTQSWKCCKCKSENYNDKWKCSWCGHERCNSCKNLLG